MALKLHYESSTPVTVGMEDSVTGLENSNIHFILVTGLEVS